MKTATRRSYRMLALAFALAGCACAIAATAIASSGDTTRMSVGAGGVQGDGVSYGPAISSDGRFVVFPSLASNLVAGDSNGVADIFVRDRISGVTTRVSVGTGGVQGNGASSYSSISSDGRYVAFASTASNLVAADTNANPDVFVHDRDTGTTTRVSVGSGGVQGNRDHFVPVISANGRYVVFGSWSTNLVSGDTNDFPDVFVHDRDTGQTTRVSVNSSGAQGDLGSFSPAISADGRYVAFTSWGSQFVTGDTNDEEDVFVHDRVTGATTRVSVDSSGVEGTSRCDGPDVSADGRYVSFATASTLVPGDTNGVTDIFVHDRDTGQTTRVSVNSSGAQSDHDSGGGSLSSDARYVTFTSEASNLVADDTNWYSDAFIHDRVTGATSRVSVDSSGAQGDSASESYSISADGQYVAFRSYASNLVEGDTNATWDVFVHETGPATPARPKADLRTPVAPARMSHSKSYTVYGYLKPRHTKGGYPVRIYKYRKTSSGSWKSYGYAKAKASNHSSYTKYSATMKLTSKGTWRLRAYAPADSGHVATWSSGYDYVKVY